MHSLSLNNRESPKAASPAASSLNACKRECRRVNMEAGSSRAGAVELCKLGWLGVGNNCQLRVR